MLLQPAAEHKSVRTKRHRVPGFTVATERIWPFHRCSRCSCGAAAGHLCGRRYYENSPTHTRTRHRADDLQGRSAYGTASLLASPGGAVGTCRKSLERSLVGVTWNTLAVERFLGLSGTAWTAIYTIITCGLLVVAVVAALYAKKQWQIGREQTEDARKARAEGIRPYIVVAIEPSGASRHLFDLTVKNIGQRPALGVSIRLDPPPKRARETAGHEIAKAKMLNEPVAMIAPAQEMRAFYDSHVERNGREELPTSHQVSLTYRDSSRRQYSETSVLDIEALKGTMFTSVQTLHDIGKTLEKIEETFSGASLLRRSGSVEVEASIETRGEQRQRLAADRAEWEEQHSRMIEQLLPANSAETQVVSDASPQADESER